MDKLQYAHICLGSNHDGAYEKLSQTVFELAALDWVGDMLQSPVFRTEPQAYRDQAWFYNMCLKLTITENISARDMLQEFLELERKLGRVRNSDCRFGPRAIDIDLLLYGEIVSRDTFCVLPHPRMHERAFALFPLYLLDPEIRLNGKNLTFWLNRLDWRLEGDRIYQK